jgi:hypothetical protein
MSAQERDLRLNAELNRVRGIDERQYFKRDDKFLFKNIEIKQYQNKILRPPTPRDLKLAFRKGNAVNQA